jgi:transposase
VFVRQLAPVVGRLERQARTCRKLRVHASQPVAEQILRAELRRLAGHIAVWDRELRANKAQLRRLVQQFMPALLYQPGVGPMSAAQLLVLVSPRPVPLRSCLRRPSRSQPAAGILRQDHPPQPQVAPCSGCLPTTVKNTFRS